MLRGTAALLVVTLATSTGANQVVRSALFKQDGRFSDVIFTNDQSFDGSARSVHECARDCLRAGDKCVSFTYQESAVTSCRGYTRTMTSNSGTVQATGAKTFGPRCPLSDGFNYESHSGLCVKIHNSRMNHSSAQRKCEEEGANLITLDTDEKIAGWMKGPHAPVSEYEFVPMALTRPASETTNNQLSVFVWTVTGQDATGIARYFRPPLLDGNNCGHYGIYANGTFYIAIGICSFQNFYFVCEVL